MGKFEVIGGFEYLGGLPDKVPLSSNASKYIKIVEEKSILRQLIKASNEMIDLGYTQTEDVEAIMDQAEKKIYDIMQVNRRKELFPQVTDEQWNDWHWQVKNRIETLDQLKQYISLTEEEEEGVRVALKTLRMAITPYYLSLIDPNNPNDPVRRQAIPTIKETHQAAADLLDPLHEDEDSPVPGITHRYPDRVLFLITDMCSMYCRHCTRRRFAGQKDANVGTDLIQQGIDYIARTPQVRDVLLSGGDCLMVSDEMLESIIKRLRAIPHVEIIRMGSRTPVVCPMRITDKLVNMIKQYSLF